MQLLINMHILQVPHFFLILSMLIIEHVKTVPHIFNENYEFCEHSLRKPDKKILFINKLWSIETTDFILYFSFCKTVQSECLNQTSSCLVRKSDNELIDLGLNFQQSVDDDNIFETVNGAKCPHSDGTYALTVTLECSDTVKQTPRLIMPDDDTCNFEVTMMKPDCKPKCTEVIQGAYLIDLRKSLKNIDVNTDSRRFSISVCGSSRRCGSADVAACEFLNDNSTVPLAVTSQPQFVTYDINKNELTARGRFKDGRVVREVFILIKCNWETELSNAKYKVVPEQGRKYKFELESSHGCIKIPQDCFVTSMLDNLHYNLSNLYNPNGWEIANAPQGRILLNICGPLNNPPNTPCSDQHSQVCHIQDNGYINRGSILTSLKAADDVVKAVFSSGSRCKENATLLYSTQIEFRCSASEKGPTFKEFQGCTMVLLWETPHACPVDLYKGHDCIIHDRVGYRNLKNLFTATDRSVVPAEGQELIYNFCGPIHEKCNDFNNVSFCLKVSQDNQVIIGWDKRELISDNGLLRMELTGNKCLNSDSYGKININFICNYEEPAPPAQINVIEDRCRYNMTVFTSLACFSQNTFHHCNYNVKNNVSYDLSPLSYKDRNHVIKGEDGIEYILNICGPIINGPGALCRSDTMICLRNKTEINLKYQYISLGGVSSEVSDTNDLVIRSQIGSYCQGYGHYRTFIHFECSLEKLPPTLSSKSPCVYNFTWKTPEACPRNCLIKDLRAGSSLDLNTLNKKILNINLDNGTVLYTFHLCKDIYFKEAKETRSVYYLKRTLSVENNTKYLTLDLQQGNHSDSECKTASKINKAIFEFRCDASSSTHFEEKRIKNCILNMIIPTNVVCSNGKQDLFYNLIPPSQHSTSTEDVKLVQPTKPPKENKCLLVSEDTGNQLKLTDLKSREIYNGTSKLSLNFDGKLRCDGILCKNDIQLLPMDACPSNIFDYQSNQVILHYSTELVCSPNEYFRLQLQLKCSNTVFEQVILKNTSCEMIIAHHLKDVCILFHEDVKSSKATVIGVVCGVIILFIALFCIVIYIYRKRLPYILIPCDSDKKSVPIYVRDSTL